MLLCNLLYKSLRKTQSNDMATMRNTLISHWNLKREICVVACYKHQNLLYETVVWYCVKLLRWPQRNVWFQVWMYFQNGSS